MSTTRRSPRWRNWKISAGRIRLCPMDTQRAQAWYVKHAYRVGSWSRRVKSCEISNLLPRKRIPVPEGELPSAGGDGFINIEQNRIIKIFGRYPWCSCHRRWLLPAYGMNFGVYPGTERRLQATQAIILAILAGLAPYLHFISRRTGCLYKIFAGIKRLFLLSGFMAQNCFFQSHAGWTSRSILFFHGVDTHCYQHKKKWVLRYDIH